MSANKKVIAHFQPQASINDNCINIDGKFDFDVTDLIVDMGKDKAMSIEDCQYSSDALYHEWVVDHPEKEHTGPFYVQVEESIREFFGE